MNNIEKSQENMLNIFLGEGVSMQIFLISISFYVFVFEAFVGAAHKNTHKRQKITLQKYTIKFIQERN